MAVQVVYCAHKLLCKTPYELVIKLAFIFDQAYEALFPSLFENDVKLHWVSLLKMVVITHDVLVVRKFLENFHFVLGRLHGGVISSVADFHDFLTLTLMVLWGCV